MQAGVTARRRGNLLRLLHFVRNDIFEDVNFLGRSLKYSPRKGCGSKPHPFLTGFTPLENPFLWGGNDKNEFEFLIESVC